MSLAAVDEFFYNVVAPTLEWRVLDTEGVVETCLVFNVRGPHAEPAAVLSHKDGVFCTNGDCCVQPVVEVDL